MSTPKEVSFDSYRSDGVSVFLGRGRGKAVAEAIKKEHGSDVEIKVPDDVYYISRGFRIAFKDVLPNTTFPDHIPKID